MTAARTIPDHVRAVQISAADPDVSAFVSANAGSGKTHVLAQRVTNLLLRGCDPAKILCITFTKAAAANMANRVFGTLAEWTALDDRALDEKIRLSTGQKADAAQRARARRLFASALETPGGLKVQTIHAFCTRLLHQFPFEANVAARFTVLDDTATAQLLEYLTLEVLLEAAAEPDGALGRALAAAIVAGADVTLKEVIGDAIRKRDTLDEWLARAGSIETAMVELSQSLGVDPDDSIEQIEQEYFSASLIAEAEWPALMEMLGSGSANDNRHVDALAAAQFATGRERVENYLMLFCTAKREPRENILTKTLAKRFPEWAERLAAEQQRVCGLLDRERAVAARERTRALVTIAKAVIDRYAKEKARRALLDYDDLIDKTLALFGNVSAAWVLYKLDLGIDHVLIDEAQDTSPKQWEIIKTIVSEFIPGGARGDVKRTIFAVGDEKQSIFSFQGAAPEAFDQMRRLFASQFDTPELGWRHVRFHHSFRSGENVLGSVDQVFRPRDVYRSITADEIGIPEHQPLPNAAPGLVEIWPLIRPAERREIEGWDAPFDTLSEESPQVLLARRIAAKVKRDIARGGKAGDVLVLVRQRGPLFEAIIRALKDARVAVAGADRLVLTEHIAVMDLMALADCLLLPDDDLALACVLKSPLVGLSEEQLFALAWDRKASLRARLRAKATDDPAVAAAEQALAGMAQAALGLSPFAFYAHVLGAMRGRGKILARLGPEANDALDEFLNLALDYESRETPSLQGFLAWLRAARSEVKRDMEIVRDEVRVMTVHGAKGLEAKTVILADTTTPPAGPRDPRLMTLANGALVWATAQANDVGPIADARAGARLAARDEYRRLLYVAMTRAAERLIVCGCQGRNKIPEGCWYELVVEALRADCISETTEDGEVLRYRKLPEPGAELIVTPSAAEPAQPLLPAWLRRDAAPEPIRERTVTPSTAIEEEEIARTIRSGGRPAARLRGVLLHRLLQWLPDIPPERRGHAATKYLAHAAHRFPEDESAKLAQQALHLLKDATFCELFAPGSRAEVPIVGKVKIAGHPFRVSGQIDRLAVTDGSVLIGDFKTTGPPPRRIEDVPEAYVAQLTLYRAVLAKLYPHKLVRTALIWTEGPDLMELSPEVLDAALAQISPDLMPLDAAGRHS